VGCDAVRSCAFVREPVGRRRVQAGPLPEREIRLDRRPYDRVHEAQRATLLKDPGGGELVGRGCGSAGVHVGETGCEPKVCLAQHSRGTCQLASSRREAPQPLHDRV
jgi:hypothetical protein